MLIPEETSDLFIRIPLFGKLLFVKNRKTIQNGRGYTTTRTGQKSRLNRITAIGNLSDGVKLPAGRAAQLLKCGAPQTEPRILENKEFRIIPQHPFPWYYQGFAKARLRLALQMKCVYDYPFC
jgi:hypothetical protein